jgi:hypothetical protein
MKLANQFLIIVSFKRRSKTEFKFFVLLLQPNF